MDLDEKHRLSKRNRSFISGQPVGDDLRSLAITLILEAGGNTDSQYIPRGVLSSVASQLKLSKTCMKNIWSRYCETGSVRHRPHGGAVDSKLKELDLLYIEQLKREKHHLRGGFKKFEEKCCQVCNCHNKFMFSVHVVN